MPFAFLKICFLPWCTLRAFIHEYFVNRGVFAAACSQLGRLELPWQGREWSIRPSCAARQVLVARRQRQPCHGAGGSLPFSEKVHIPQRGFKGSLSVPEAPSTFICGRRGAPTTRCSELPWASADLHLPYVSPFSSKHPSNFHQNYLTSFLVASPKVAHMVKTSGCAQPLEIELPL